MNVSASSSLLSSLIMPHSGLREDSEKPLSDKAYDPTVGNSKGNRGVPADEVTEIRAQSALVALCVDHG